MINLEALGELVEVLEAHGVVKKAPGARHAVLANAFEHPRRR